MNERVARAHLIARVHLAHEPDFALGKLEVRPARREIAREGYRDTIDPRVMRVLVALARASGEILSRDDLNESCWDGVIVGEDAITRCIGRLRAAAEASGNEFSIETIPRVGYRLVTADGAAVGAQGVGWSKQPTAQTAVAVLPFVNMSGDRSKEYFSDGFSQELINRLSNDPRLCVVGRTSAFAFKGKNEDVGTIARALHARAIVEGSVRENGDRVRITAHLVNAADGDGDLIWSATYDRDLTDILSVQDEIAHAVTTSLTGERLPRTPQIKTGRRTTVNAEAYRAYLEGNVIC